MPWTGVGRAYFSFLGEVFTVDDKSGVACLWARLSVRHVRAVSSEGATEGALTGASCR